MSISRQTTMDGTLATVTVLQMKLSGLRWRVQFGLLGAVLFALLMFHIVPAYPPDASPLFGEPIGTTYYSPRDMLQWRFASGKLTPVKYPQIIQRVAQLPYRELAAQKLRESESAYWLQYRKYGVSAAVGFIFFFVGLTAYSRRVERRQSEPQYVRGAQLTTARELTKIVKKNAIEMGDQPSRLTVADVLIPRRNEITPWSVIGRPQVGKSTLFKALLDQIISMSIGKRVVFDSKGDYTSTHFQGGDHIFAPSVDVRSLRWTIFNDVSSLSRISDMAAALIPEGGKEPMWAAGARLILEGILLHCWYTGKKTNAYVWQVACQPADKLKEILAATPGAEMAAALLDKPEVTTSFSFTVNLKTYLKPLQLLARMDGPFSVRQWLTDGKNDGLFIVSVPDHLETLKPLMNLFLSTLLTAHKSLPDDRSRRVFYLLDELGVLPKVPGLSDALNFGPSKGLCCFLGYQSYQQIDELYGRNVMEAMVSSAATHVAFSVGNEKTLEELSKLIGEAEVIESRGTLTTGISDNRHGGSSMDQLVKKRLVMPDTIKDLPPLNAYLKLLGYPAVKITLKYVPYPIVAESLVPDPTFDLDLYLAELSQLRTQAVGPSVQVRTTENKQRVCGSTDVEIEDTTNIRARLMTLDDIMS
ncbi:MAG: type IV secretion system DNA-binding domain-containing protein [Geobacter sp.]